MPTPPRDLQREPGAPLGRVGLPAETLVLSPPEAALPCPARGCVPTGQSRVRNLMPGEWLLHMGRRHGRAESGFSEEGS